MLRFDVTYSSKRDRPITVLELASREPWSSKLNDLETRENGARYRPLPRGGFLDPGKRLLGDLLSAKTKEQYTYEGIGGGFGRSERSIEGEVGEVGSLSRKNPRHDIYFPESFGHNGAKVIFIIIKNLSQVYSFRAAAVDAAASYNQACFYGPRTTEQQIYLSLQSENSKFRSG